MQRRLLLKAAAAIPVIPGAELLRLASAQAEDGGLNKVFSRVRPGDAGWPSDENWNKLSRLVEGRLITVTSPLSICREAPDGPSCARSI